MFRNEMLAFARGKGGMEIGNLNSILDDALELAQHRLKHIEIEKRYGQIPSISFFQTGVKHIFLNMIVNAAEAMYRKGGKITIATYVDGNHVVASITDTGEGMESDKLDKIFEGKSTKHGGRAIGALFCKSIIDKHNGSISYESEKGVGTMVFVKLPLIQGVQLVTE